MPAWGCSGLPDPVGLVHPVGLEYPEGQQWTCHADPAGQLHLPGQPDPCGLSSQPDPAGQPHHQYRWCH